MSRFRPVMGRACVCACLFSVATFAPPAFSAEPDVPPAVLGLVPEGVRLGSGRFDVIDSEFGKTFGGSLQAASFPGQRPSCVYAGTPELKIELKGDTAFEAPPMLEMAIAMHQQEVDRAPVAMAEFATSYIKAAPDVVSVGSVQAEPLGSGRVVYLEYAEDCSSHSRGYKTRLEAFARRGATQLLINMVVALKSAEARALAGKIIERFDAMDIASLTR